MREKRKNVKHIMEKSDEKGDFESPWSGFLGLKGATPIILGP